MKENRAPGISWFMRRPVHVYPNGYVLTCEDDLIQVVYFEARNDPQSLILSRRDARLLVKRITQCLDETKGWSR